MILLHSHEFLRSEFQGSSSDSSVKFKQLQLDIQIHTNIENLDTIEIQKYNASWFNFHTGEGQFSVH